MKNGLVSMADGFSLLGHGGADWGSYVGFSGYVPELDVGVCLASNSNYITGQKKSGGFAAFTSVGMNAELSDRQNEQAYNYAQVRADGQNTYFPSST